MEDEDEDDGVVNEDETAIVVDVGTNVDEVVDVGGDTIRFGQRLVST